MEEALTSTLTTAVPVVQEVASAAAPAADIPTWFVVVLGVVIVFIGLICLIALITLMGAIMKKVNAKHESIQEAAAPAAVSEEADIPNRSELVAAVSVALAEELGKDVKAIRIHSIKRV